MVEERRNEGPIRPRHGDRGTIDVVTKIEDGSSLGRLLRGTTTCYPGTGSSLPLSPACFPDSASSTLQKCKCRSPESRLLLLTDPIRSTERSVDAFLALRINRHCGQDGVSLPFSSPVVTGFPVGYEYIPARTTQDGGPCPQSHV